jgi:hypothetical protein
MTPKLLVTGRQTMPKIDSLHENKIFKLNYCIFQLRALPSLRSSPQGN